MAVVASAVVSLDGFIAYDDNTVGPLFDWYNNGPVETYGTDMDRPFHVTQASADYIRATWPKVKATVIGRTLFDFTNGWNGVPPASEHVFVVTHNPPTDWPFPDAPFTFVDGLEQAIAQAKEYSGDGDVAVTGGNLTGQALAAGLVDEIAYSVVPALLGKGKRFFGDYAGEDIPLENPWVVEGDRVTHLHYKVKKG